MRRMIKANVNLITKGRMMLLTWGKSERREMSRMAPKLATSGEPSVHGFDVDTVTAKDLEVVGLALQDLRDNAPEQFEVLNLFYRHNLPVVCNKNQVGIATQLGEGKTRVYMLKELGEFFVAGRI